jgi:alpha-D-xyloside xylohydrolase
MKFKVCNIFVIAFSVICLFSCSSVSWQDTKKGIVIQSKKGALTLSPQNDNAIRVQFTQAGSKALEELIFIENNEIPTYTVEDKDGNITFALEKISAIYNKKSGTLSFKNANEDLLLQEKPQGRIMTADSIQGEPTYAIEQQFLSPADEYLYGTGQFQDGYLNIKGLTRRLTQVNTQIAIPFILSSKGYGLLWHNYGLTDFNPADDCIKLSPMAAEGETETVDVTSSHGTIKEVRNFNGFTGTIEIPQTGQYALLLDVGQKMARKHYLSIDGKVLVEVNNRWLPPTTSIITELTAGKHEIQVRGEEKDEPVLYYKLVTDETVFRSPVAEAIDYTVFAGVGDEVIGSYRQLTGAAPMMPRWALGYIHCRERFHTQAELLEIAREFRKRQLPVDVLVQDWQYWGKYGWNTMRFDEDLYPDPLKMVNELHDMNIKMMISVWSKIDKGSDLNQAFADRGFLIPETNWVDFFNPEAAAFYWKNFNEGLVQPYHIDSWWQDATEPENDDLVNRKINNGATPGEIFRNVYPMYVNKTVYEGLRKDDPGKRTMILTRSGFSGMQRYAAATWSGDVGNDWETLRRQIAGGLGQMAAGLPWWTYDAGGFFRTGSTQFEDAAYHERFLRWFEAATFLPLQRVHGYQTDTEFWRYGKEVERISKRYLDLRYRMLPYIYSQAAAISFNGSTLMRPLVMDFSTDLQALEQKHEFTFGPAFLVAPVVEPNVNQWSVYLPQSQAGWVDFWTGESYTGGKNITIPVDLETTPLFVKAGSILPLGPTQQYNAQKPDAAWEIRIYPGADAKFTIYEDEGDSYNYENGASSTYDLTWNDAAQTLTIGDKQGTFTGMNQSRELKIVKVAPKKGTGIGESNAQETVVYNGKTVQVKL